MRHFYRIHVEENDSEVLYTSDLSFNLPDTGKEFLLPDNEYISSVTVGKLYDWVGGFSWAPFVKHKVWQRINSWCQGPIQWHGPFLIRGERYYWLNCTKVIDCLSSGSSNFRMHIRYDIVDGIDIFRPAGFTMQLIVSETFRQSTISAGDTGIRFGQIKQSGEVENPFI